MGMLGIILFIIMVGLAISLIPLCISYFRYEKKIKEQREYSQKLIQAAKGKPTSFTTRDSDGKYPFHRGHRYTNPNGVELKKIWTSKQK